jgi:hypothetical protein
MVYIDLKDQYHLQTMMHSLATIALIKVKLVLAHLDLSANKINDLYSLHRVVIANPLPSFIENHLHHLFLKILS